MSTKSINLKHDDAVGLADIIEKDPRVGGPSEALKYCFEDAARIIPNWESVIEKAKELDYAKNIPERDIGVTRTFIVEDEVYIRVFNSVKEQLHMKKPQASFLTRLCIYASRVKYYEEKIENTEQQIIDIDGVELMRQVCEKTYELIKKGNIEDIERYLEV